MPIPGATPRALARDPIDLEGARAVGEIPDHHRARAMRATPALIKAYLRLGGFVGEGAWIDHAFNTTDVCLILDTTKMNQRQARLYQGGTV